MRRVLALFGVLLAAAAAIAWPAGAEEETNTYAIEMYNAFGLVEGSDVRIAGVNAGSVVSLDVNSDKRAVVEVDLAGPLSQLGSETTCSSEPQSLIAEYYLDCTPKGDPLPSGQGDPENPDVPASRVSQTVQPDLAQSAFRAPYVDRLQILLNEFGTALAGNPENLNEAIRLGAPALTETQKVTSILARQNTTIRDLNVNSDRIVGRLADNRADVVRFVREASTISENAESRGEDLQRDFDQLDDFLAELDPTLVDLGELASEQQPLLTDLQASAPGLNELAVSLPAFNRATEVSFDSLGEASQVGEVAVRRGRDEIRQLSETSKNAGYDAELLGDLFRDLDDPGRATEVDRRSWKTCNDKSKPCYSTGRKSGGYTGMEGLLNYLYYQTLTTNQFDEVGHLLHIAIYSIGTGECGGFRSFRSASGAPEFPIEGSGGSPGTPTGFEPVGGRSPESVFTDPDLANCVGWLGPNQPGITQSEESLGIAPYDPAVCPEGSAASECDPNGARRAASVGGSDGGSNGGMMGGDGGDGGGGGGTAPDLPVDPNDPPTQPDLEDLLPGGGGNGGGGNGGNGNGGGGNGGPLDDLPGVGDALGNRDPRGGRNNGGRGGNGGNGGGGGGRGAQELLDYLFQN